MKPYLPFVIVAVVGLLTIGSGAMLYRAKRPAVITVSKELSVNADRSQALHTRGPAKAPVTMEEFGDFQCPPCGSLSGPINQLEHDFRPNLRVIFRHFPLVTHQHAHEAACAAEAAGLQGRFWEMHDLLYREQATWSKTQDVRPLFENYAAMLGLKMDRFKHDIESEEVKARVTADQRRGESLGVTNTPSIFVNDQRATGPALNPAGLRAAIDAALKAVPAH